MEGQQFARKLRAAAHQLNMEGQQFARKLRAAEAAAMVRFHHTL
jgi:hypothetical protein